MLPILPGLAAAAEHISLTQDNIGDYVRRGEGKFILQAPEDGRERHYSAGESLILPGLALDNAATELSLATKQPDQPDDLIFYGRNLEIAAGQLRIRAGAETSGGRKKRNAEEETGDNPPAAFYFIEGAANRPLFKQTGGATELSASGGATAIEGGNIYQLEGGDFRVAAEDEAITLRLYHTDINTGEHHGDDIFFSQAAGRSYFSATGEAAALKMNQSAQISGGRMEISATDKAQALILQDAETKFSQNGGEIFIKAADESRGLQTGQFQLSGGKLVLQSGGAGKALNITDIRHEDRSISGGRFIFSGGELEISRNSAAPGGYALYGEDGSRADFAAGSVFRPVLDADAEAAPIIGLASFGSVRIEPQARLDFSLKNTAKIKTDTALSLNFLESRETAIEGEFTPAAELSAALNGEKLFFYYSLEKSADNKYYRLRLKPKNKEETENENSHEQKPEEEIDESSGNNGKEPPQPEPSLKVSDIMRGNNQRAAKALEILLDLAARKNENSGAEQAAKLLYDRFYNSGTGEEKIIERGLRSLSPYQATRLPALSIKAQSRFSGRMAAEASAFYAEEPRIAEQKRPDNERVLWLTPIGAHSRLHAENSGFAALSADYGGFNFGAAAKTGAEALALAGEVNFGHLRGAENYRAEARSIFIGAGFARPLPIAAESAPLLDISVSYGNSRYRQRRRDALNTVARADIKQNSFLAAAFLRQYYNAGWRNLYFVPQIGLDYGFLRQNSWREKSGALPLKTSGAAYNSLTPKLGAALIWQSGEQINLKASALYRYAALDRNVSLKTSLRGAPAASWRVKGEAASRSGLELGLQAEYQLWGNMRFSGVYQLLQQENNHEQSFAAQIKTAF